MEHTKLVDEEVTYWVTFLLASYVPGALESGTDARNSLKVRHIVVLECLRPRNGVKYANGAPPGAPPIRFLGRRLGEYPPKVVGAFQVAPPGGVVHDTR